ncbi:MAG: alpha/beta hydrolase [Lentisphaeria bacterium]|nr:alpha/beta hydrolase [Lentisphaeria bacterium]
MENYGQALDIPLWPEGVPGRLDDGSQETVTKDGGIMRVAKIHDPEMYVFPAPAATNTGAAIVILPGGGYSIVAIEHEGFDVARWLNGIGVSAFVVKYRLSPYRHPIPLLDAQQAMRIARSRAAEWGVDPERIGVMGFSAGGHLASNVLTHGQRPVCTANPLGQVPCHANFAVLGYPVVSLVNDSTAHKGSCRNLLGDNPPHDLLVELSAETQAAPGMAPTFFFHAKDDKGVPYANSTTLAEALTRAGVPAEVHLLNEGGHGFGMRRHDWAEAMAAWLRKMGFLG